MSAPDTPEAATPLARALAGALDLPLPAEYEPGVAHNLALAFRLAGPFLAFPLPDEAEPAPVYRVVEGA